MTGSGTVTYIPASMENVERPDGTIFQRSHLKGVVVATDAAVPFHLSNQDCVGGNIIGADGALLDGHGYCDGVDADGDVWWIWWHNSVDENVWGFMGGTGKYEGIEGGGTTQVQSQSADGRMVITWEGTWQTN
jgi:hypothetical protein